MRKGTQCQTPHIRAACLNAVLSSKRPKDVQSVPQELNKGTWGKYSSISMARVMHDTGIACNRYNHLLASSFKYKKSELNPAWNWVRAFFI